MRRPTAQLNEFPKAQRLTDRRASGAGAGCNTWNVVDEKSHLPPSPFFLAARTKLGLDPDILWESQSQTGLGGDCCPLGERGSVWAQVLFHQQDSGPSLPALPGLGLPCLRSHIHNLEEEWRPS